MCSVVFTRHDAGVLLLHTANSSSRQVACTSAWVLGKPQTVSRPTWSNAKRKRDQQRHMVDVKRDLQVCQDGSDEAGQDGKTPRLRPAAHDAFHTAEWPKVVYSHHVHLLPREVRSTIRRALMLAKHKVDPLATLPFQVECSASRIGRPDRINHKACCVSRRHAGIGTLLGNGELVERSARENARLQH